MKSQLNYDWLENLRTEGKSYKEIVEITKYNKASVYGYFYRKYGKLPDRNKSRRQTIPITQEQKEILFGTLMGDAWMTKIQNSYQGRINHCGAQEKYCKHIHDKLHNLVYPLKYKNKTLKNYDKVYQMIYFCFKPNENFKEFYDYFYNPKKDVPLDLTLLTPRAMAYWFMDDGTSSGRCTISIATCSFSLNGLLRLQNFLKEKYNLEVHIQKDFKLYFTAKSAKEFYKLTKEYIIPEMLYKFKYVC